MGSPIVIFILNTTPNQHSYTTCSEDHYYTVKVYITTVYHFPSDDEVVIIVIHYLFTTWWSLVVMFTSKVVTFTIQFLVYAIASCHAGGQAVHVDPYEHQACIQTCEIFATGTWERFSQLLAQIGYKRELPWERNLITQCCWSFCANFKCLTGRRKRTASLTFETAMKPSAISHTTHIKQNRSKLGVEIHSSYRRRPCVELKCNKHIASFPGLQISRGLIFSWAMS